MSIEKIGHSKSENMSKDSVQGQIRDQIEFQVKLSEDVKGGRKLEIIRSGDQREDQVQVCGVVESLNELGIKSNDVIEDQVNEVYKVEESLWARMYEIWETAYKSDKGSKLFQKTVELLIKLNSRNITASVAQLAKLMTNENEFRIVIKAIFNKIIGDQKYMTRGVELFDAMRSIKVKSENVGEDFEFRTMIIRRCEKCLFDPEKFSVLYKQANKVVDKNLNSRTNLFKFAIGPDIAILYGELYKKGLLDNEFIDLSIDQLIEYNNDISIVSLELLLKSIGKQYAGSTEEKDKLDQQINRLKSLLEFDEIDETIRNSIKHILDARQNGWIFTRKIYDTKKQQNRSNLKFKANNKFKNFAKSGSSSYNWRN